LKIYSHTNLIKPVSQGKVSLSIKAEREFWKFVNKEKLPERHVRDSYDWGKDKNGKDIASYTIEEFNERKVKQARYRALSLFSRQFGHLRDQAKREGTELTETQFEEERTRRREMAAMKKDLYGELTAKLVQDPVYDDIIPIPMEEPENALARIAYPDFYAEGMC
jgi:protein farnesyltransferase/geranylgeranyltransferase type-1 subunit alpha